MMKQSSAGKSSQSSLRITGYTILKEVGRGGIATVYLAVQESLQRQVALKIMAPALVTDPTFTDRFIHEGRTIAQLNHPSIVTIFDISVVDFHHYIAMEYLQGGSLKQRLAKPFALNDALDVLSQMASALELAHSKGIVHRDVKPENIMFRKKGGNEAVLTDFGIAKSSTMQNQLTSDGMVVGTPRYMSPERAEGKDAVPQSDIYALGIILYEMLSGKPPYGAKENLAVLYSHLNDPIPQLPGSYAFLQSFLDKILAKKPADRFADCGSLLERLEAYRQQTTTKIPVMPSRRGRSNRDDGERTSQFGRLRQAIAALGSYAVWGGVTLASIIVLSTVIWGFMRPTEDSTLLQADLPEGESPKVITPARIDLTVPDDEPSAESVRIAEAPVDVNALFGLADKQIAKNYLSSPEGNNARDTYRAILKLEPGNAEATLGLKRIADRYETFARRHLDQGNFDRALSSIRAGLAVWPDHEGLPLLMARAEEGAATAHEPSREVGPVYEDRIREIIVSAENGNTKSQFDLALAFGNGDGVGTNYDESIKWLRRAAQGDHVGAQYNLALGLLFGPQPSANEAGRWIKELAEDHYEPAYRVLGWMYTTGIGLKRNAKEAVRWSAKNWGIPRLPNEIIDSWQASFESEYHAAIGKIREEKLTQAEHLK